MKFQPSSEPIRDLAPPAIRYPDTPGARVLSPRGGTAASRSGSAVTPAAGHTNANCELGRGTRSPPGA
jgi:hypothetical protein